METNMVSFRKELLKMNNQKQDGVLLPFNEALEEVRAYLKDKIVKMNEDEEKFGKNAEEIEVKNKEYLRKKKEKYRSLIEDCVYEHNIRVREYEGNRLKVFIDEMVEEFAGYSVLADAFNDPSVSDIFCISWNRIFIEKNGKNEKYHKTFFNPKHYENVIKRFVAEAGKQINMGDSKIVDFELFGDRGCATSKGVSPMDYTLTIRKHAEDHIVLEQLIEGKVFDEKISEFLGIDRKSVV